MKIRDQADLQVFVEKYLERIANVGITITPQMTKATSDMIGQYISLKQLEMEQSAIKKSLGAEDKEEGD